MRELRESSESVKVQFDERTRIRRQEQYRREQRTEDGSGVDEEEAR
jgi:hypothetical protein